MEHNKIGKGIYLELGDIKKLDGAISGWISDNRDYEMSVVVCCFDKETYGV